MWDNELFEGKQVHSQKELPYRYMGKDRDDLPMVEARATAVLLTRRSVGGATSSHTVQDLSVSAPSSYRLLVVSYHGPHKLAVMEKQRMTNSFCKWVGNLQQEHTPANEAQIPVVVGGDFNFDLSELEISPKVLQIQLTCCPRHPPPPPASDADSDSESKEASAPESDASDSAELIDYLFTCSRPCQLVLWDPP
jgi:hypothetical protein